MAFPELFMRRSSYEERKKVGVIVIVSSPACCCSAVLETNPRVFQSADNNVCNLYGWWFPGYFHQGNFRNCSKKVGLSTISPFVMENMQTASRMNNHRHQGEELLNMK
jgi:hypothetical protein